MQNKPPKKVMVVQVNAPKIINGKNRQEITIKGEYGNTGVLMTENFLPNGFTGETTLEIWDYKNKLYGKGAPQQAQEGSQQTAQSEKPPQSIDNGAEVRQALVCAGIQSGQLQIRDNNIQDLEYWKNYIITGRAPLPADKQQTEDDAPWEQG